MHSELRLLTEAVVDLQALGAAPGGAEYASELPARLRAAQAAAAARPLPPPDAYAALGVARSAGTAVPTEARKAYRRAALRLHPDKARHALPPAAGGGGVEAELEADAARLFKLASDAHEALCSDAARASYDDAEAQRAARAARYAPQARGFAARHAPHEYGRPPRRSWGGYQYAYAAADDDDEDDEDDFHSYAYRSRSYY